MHLRDLLVDHSDNVFGRTFRRLGGLTDDELVWEPAPNCWSVRRRADGTVRLDWAPYIGDAVVTASGITRTTSTGGDAADPPPLTNLAWRLSHLTDVYGRSHNERALTGRETADPPLRPRDTAEAALSDLSEAHDRWRAVLTSLREDELSEPVLHHRHETATKVGYIVNMIDEFAHHGAELGVLRDLFAQHRRPDPVAMDPPNLADVAWAGLWHRMAPLIDAGADPDAESRGVRVLHLAAAAGERDVVERLLRRGADAAATCPLPVVWGGAPSAKWPGETALQWAEHFARDEVADLLASASASTPSAPPTAT